jgi:hypothetical protein
VTAAEAKFAAAQADRDRERYALLARLTAAEAASAVAIETEKAATALRSRIAALEAAMTKGKADVESLQAHIARVTSERDAANAACAKADARARQLAEQLVVERAAAAEAANKVGQELTAANTELGILRGRERARLQRAASRRLASGSSGGDEDKMLDESGGSKRPSIDGGDAGGSSLQADGAMMPQDAPPPMVVAPPSPVKAPVVALDPTALKSAAEQWFDTHAVS